MVVTDLQHRLVRPNMAFADLLGYALEDVPRLTMMDITHPDDVVESLLRREALLSGELNYFQMEKRYVHRDGRIFWGLTNVSLIRDQQNVPVWYLGQVQDITERKLADAKLLESESRYRSVVEGSMQGILIHQDGLTRYVNGACLRIFRFDDASELVGHDWQKIVLPSYRAELAARAAATLAGENMKPHSGWLGLRKDGQTIWLESIVSRIEWNGRPAVVAAIIEITERKELEEQVRHAQKMEAMGRLAGGVAHDFNNLLTVILGYGGLLSECSLMSPDNRELILQIVRAGERATKLTRQLLAFSHKQALIPVVLDVNELIGDMHGMLARVIGETIALRFLPSPVAGRIKADPGQLEQVVMNLVVNARDALDGGGQITIETYPIELRERRKTIHLDLEPGSYSVISISDNGCGMDEKTIAQIFEPFYTTKSPDRGTGLGLAIVHGIIVQTCGGIEVASEVGVGTVFKVYFPQVHEAVQTQPSRLVETNSVRGTESILLVEDEDGVRTLARHILENYGYGVLEARDGDEALAICANHNGEIPLLVSDMVMPNMSGQELAGRLSTVRPGMRVLFLSGYTDDAVIHHGMITPDTPFLPKPFSPDALANKVRIVLDA